MTTIRTPADLKYAVESRGTESHFFTRNNMRFAGDTMRNFGLCTAYIATDYDSEDRYVGERGGIVVQVYMLYRKQPVKRGVRSPFFFDMTTFKQRHGELCESPQFKVGDWVAYTNPYGIYWGIKRIIGIEYRTKRPCYYFSQTDTPWFAVGEENLKLVKVAKPISRYTLYGHQFKTHAFNTVAGANEFMEANEGWGLIGIEKHDDIERFFHVAHASDKPK